MCVTLSASSMPLTILSNGKALAQDSSSFMLRGGISQMSPWLPELKNSDLTLVMHVLHERPAIP